MRVLSAASLFLVLIALTVCITSGVSSASDQATDVPLSLIKSYNTGYLTSASGLFHYPASYTQEEKRQGADAVRSVLEVFKDEFGMVSDYRIHDGPYEWYRVIFGSGDMTYWRHYPKFTKVVYDVEFGRLGKGYIEVGLVNISKKTEIRHIAYGVPKDSPGAKRKMSAILEKMQAIFQQAG